MSTNAYCENFRYPVMQRAFGAGNVQIAARVWASYLGYVEAVETYASMRVQCRALGTVSQAAALGIYTTPAPATPGLATQDFTRQFATSALTSMLAGVLPFDVIGSLAITLQPGWYVWGLSWFNFGGVQPSVSEGTSHTALGDCMMLDGAPALDAAGGALLTLNLPTIANVNHGPPFFSLDPRP